LKRSDANRYARWAAGSALALTALVAVFFGWRWWQARQAVKLLPPPVPQTVQKRSAEFSFSKVEGERTLFTVRAAQATEFREGGRSQLLDVWITIYGRAGKRFDNIYTRECTYLLGAGRIQCTGEVQMDLESAVEARERPGQRVLHVGTRNVIFERETGEAYTKEPVVFRFPYGHGRGSGLSYSTRRALFRMHGEVLLTLTSNGPDSRVGDPVELTGSSLEYGRATGTMRLEGPVRVRQAGRELTAQALTLEMDEQLRAHRLLATGKPELRVVETADASRRETASLAADQFAAHFNAEGLLERIIAEGDVRGSRRLGPGEDHLSTARLEIECEPGNNQPRVMKASGGVRVESRLPNQTRRLETAALQVDVARSSRGRRLAGARTLAPGVLEWVTDDESTRVRGAQLASAFGEDSRVRRLTGSGGVEIERRFGGRPAQLTAARELEMAFNPIGQWTESSLRGAVRFREGLRSAEADRARLLRATEQTMLEGNVVVADSLTRTTAGSLVIHQRTGEIRGEGGVHTSYLGRERDAIADLAPQPAHITAERLVATRETGQALYSGNARLWQGDSVIQAAEIDLQRNGRRLDARGSVTALFPETSAPGESRAALLWTVRAGSLSYFSEQGRAHLQRDVRVESSNGRIRAPRLDLFLSSPQRGARHLIRAEASGGATVQHSVRRGEAERAEYDAAEGKFVLSGGSPTVYDAARGATTGRKLTFFLADDKILVESDAGSRTLTRHRVEK